MKQTYAPGMSPEAQRERQDSINRAAQGVQFKKAPTPALDAARARSYSEHLRYMAKEFVMGRRRGGISKP